MPYENAYVWRAEPETGRPLYVGEFLEFELALVWVKRQKSPESYRVNNVAPTGVVREFRRDPQAVLTDEDKSFAYDAVKNYLDNPESSGYIPIFKEAIPFEKPKPAKVTYGNPWERKPYNGPTAVHAKPKTAPKLVRAKNAQELALEAEAAKELQKHKQAEAQDIEAEFEVQD